MIKKLFIITLLFFVFLLKPFTVFAQITPTATITPTPLVQIEYALPYPGILPNHPLYIFKIIRDKILLFSTRDTLKKSELMLLFADKNLVMTQMLLEENETDLGFETLKNAEQNLLNSVSNLTNVKNMDKLPPGITQKYEQAGKKHEEIINKMVTVSNNEETKNTLTNILETTHQAKQYISSLK